MIKLKKFFFSIHTQKKLDQVVQILSSSQKYLFYLSAFQIIKTFQQNERQLDFHHALISLKQLTKILQNDKRKADEIQLINTKMIILKIENDFNKICNNDMVDLLFYLRNFQQRNLKDQISSSLMEKIRNYVQDMVKNSDMSYHDNVNLLYSLYFLNIRCDQLPIKILKQITENLQNLTDFTFLQILYSINRKYTNLGHQDYLLVSYLVSICNELNLSFSLEQKCQIFKIISSFQLEYNIPKFQQPPLIKQLLYEFQNKIHQLNQKNIIDILHGYRYINQQKFKFLQELQKVILNDLETYSVQFLFDILKISQEKVFKQQDFITNIQDDILQCINRKITQNKLNQEHIKACIKILDKMMIKNQSLLIAEQILDFIKMNGLQFDIVIYQFITKQGIDIGHIIIQQAEILKNEDKFGFNLFLNYYNKKFDNKLYLLENQIKNQIDLNQDIIDKLKIISESIIQSDLQNGYVMHLLQKYLSENQKIQYHLVLKLNKSKQTLKLLTSQQAILNLDDILRVLNNIDENQHNYLLIIFLLENQNNYNKIQIIRKLKTQNILLNWIKQSPIIYIKFLNYLDQNIKNDKILNQDIFSIFLNLKNCSSQIYQFYQRRILKKYINQQIPVNYHNLQRLLSLTLSIDYLSKEQLDNLIENIEKFKPQIQFLIIEKYHRSYDKNKLFDFNQNLQIKLEQNLFHEKKPNINENFYVLMMQNCQSFKIDMNSYLEFIRQNIKLFNYQVLIDILNIIPQENIQNDPAIYKKFFQEIINPNIKNKENVKLKVIFINELYSKNLISKVEKKNYMNSIMAIYQIYDSPFKISLQKLFVEIGEQLYDSVVDNKKFLNQIILTFDYKNLDQNQILYLLDLSHNCFLKKQIIQDSPLLEQVFDKLIKKYPENQNIQQSIIIYCIIFNNPKEKFFIIEFLKNQHLEYSYNEQYQYFELLQLYILKNHPDLQIEIENQSQQKIQPFFGTQNEYNQFIHACISNYFEQKNIFAKKCQIENHNIYQDQSNNSVYIFIDKKNTSQKNYIHILLKKIFREEIIEILDVKQLMEFYV